MRAARRVALVTVASASLLLGSPALADPPPGQNPNAGVFTLHCTRGAETQTFETISIVQSAALALQLLDGTGVIMYTHVEVNGQVVYDRTGQAGQTDLCKSHIDIET
jgi:hypothetical protein